jgi:hypothetical protein
MLPSMPSGTARSLAAARPHSPCGQSPQSGHALTAEWREGSGAGRPSRLRVASRPQTLSAGPTAGEYGGRTPCGSGLAVPVCLVGWSEPGNQPRAVTPAAAPGPDVRDVLLAVLVLLLEQEVRLGDDPEHTPVRVHHRQRAHPPPGQPRHNLLERRRRVDGHYVGRHHVFLPGCSWVFLGSNPSDMQSPGCASSPGPMVLSWRWPPGPRWPQGATARLDVALRGGRGAGQ